MADSTIAALDISGHVPPCFDAYRPLIQEALALFVRHLPAQRQAEIVGMQAALPADADAVTRLVTLIHACPTLHKFGQVIARNRHLDAPLRRALQGLETRQAVMPLSTIEPVVHAELRSLGVSRLEIVLDRQPMAEASVAVVVGFAWKDAADEDDRSGVLKILKPGIVERVEEELDALAAVAGELDARRERLDLPDIDFSDTFETVRLLLRNEIRLDHEREHLSAAARRHAGSARVFAPRPLSLCTPHMLAMQRVRGVKVTEIDAISPGRRRTLARTIVEAMVADVVFSTEPMVMFHADPHAGNLFATDDERLAILDWALVGRLSKCQRELASQAIAGAVVRDASRVLRAIASLAASTVDERRARSCIDAALKRISFGAIPGPAWLMSLLDSLATAGVSFPADLMWLRKAILTLDGVVSDVCEEVSLDGVLQDVAMTAFLNDWPRRALAWPDSREFATHLSNFDLAALWSSMPLAAMKQWLALVRNDASPDRAGAITSTAPG